MILKCKNWVNSDVAAKDSGKTISDNTRGDKCLYKDANNITTCLPPSDVVTPVTASDILVILHRHTPCQSPITVTFQLRPEICYHFTPQVWKPQ